MVEPPCHVDSPTDMCREFGCKRSFHLRLPQALLAELLVAGGRVDDARVQFAELAREGFRDVPRNISWLATLTLCGHVAAITRDDAVCHLLYELLAPYSGRIGWSGVTAYPVDLVLGTLASAVGDADRAFRYLDSKPCSLRHTSSAFSPSGP